MIHVQVDDLYQSEFPPEVLEKAALETLAHQDVPAGAELSIVVTGEDVLHELNLQYLGVDAPTDVLSFSAREKDPESGVLYLGDVLIAFPRAAAQAVAAGHPVLAELQLLTVHGVLHLLGHDHADPAEKDRMWSAQKEILSSLGSAAELPPP
jgi:probable rRNA maturation factor